MGMISGPAVLNVPFDLRQVTAFLLNSAFAACNLIAVIVGNGFHSLVGVLATVFIVSLSLNREEIAVAGLFIVKGELNDLVVNRAVEVVNIGLMVIRRSLADFRHTGTGGRGAADIAGVHVLVAAPVLTGGKIAGRHLKGNIMLLAHPADIGEKLRGGHIVAGQLQLKQRFH